MSIAPFDHPFLSGLLGDAEVAALLSAEADLAAMIRFEAGLARAEAACGVIPDASAQRIAAVLEGFAPNLASLATATARNGVVVADLVRQIREAVGGDAAGDVHFGATSQDVIDTSLALRLGPIIDLFAARLAEVDAVLDALAARDGAIEVMAHTRMQAAIPVPAARKIESWLAPLVRARARLPAIRDEACILHFGGAAGTLEKLGDAADAVRRDLAARLGLGLVIGIRHSERDGIAALASWLSLVTGSLGKLGADISLLAQSEVGEVRLSGGGGSSAMPHKVNPVGAEVLVALARFNATLLSGMHQSLVHENERSGAAWTLEWMLLPQMLMAAGAALRTSVKLLDGLAFVPRRAGQGGPSRA